MFYTDETEFYLYIKVLALKGDKLFSKVYYFYIEILSLCNAKKIMYQLLFGDNGSHIQGIARKLRKIPKPEVLKSASEHRLRGE